MKSAQTAPPFYRAYWMLIKACFAHVGVMKRRYIAALFLLATAQALLRLTPVFLGAFINAIQTGGEDVLQIAFFWLGLYLVFDNVPWVFWKPGRQWERQSAFMIRQNFYDRHYHTLRHLPIKWHQDHHSGNTINRLRKASEALFEFGQEQYEYIGKTINILVCIGVLLWFSPILAGLAVLCLVAVIALIRLHDRYLVPLYTKANEYEHKFFEGFFDYVSSMMTVITLRLGEKSQADLNRRHARIKPFFWREARINENKYLLLTLFTSTSTVLVLGGYTYTTLQDGVIQIGTLIMLFQYFNNFTDSCYFLAWQLERTTRWYNDFKAAEPILTATPRDSKDVVKHPAWHTLELRDLSFRHVPDGPLVVDHVNLAMRPGQKIAVIGESGSGKSTLMALLRGVYEPMAGSLWVDGVAQDDFHPLYDRTTLIPQEPEIFENTIRHNLTLGMNYSLDQILAAARMAAFDRVADKLPERYQSDIREKGVNLSGGEKQRLALARGLLAALDADIVVMDEPSSALDAATEAEVFDNIFSAYGQKTLIVTLHRLHRLPMFDHIVVMSQGKIVDQGAFATLMSRPGPLADLWAKYQNVT